MVGCRWPSSTNVRLPGLALVLLLVAVPAWALTRIDPTAVIAGGPAFTLRGFEDPGNPFDPDENTFTWRRADQPASQATALATTAVGNTQLQAQVPASFIAEPGDFLVGIVGDDEGFPFTVLSSSARPVARDDFVRAYRDTPVTIDILANDFSSEGFDPASVRIIRGAGNGFPRRNADGTVTYTPNPGFSGDDSFT